MDKQTRNILAIALLLCLISGCYYCANVYLLEHPGIDPAGLSLPQDAATRMTIAQADFAPKIHHYQDSLSTLQSENGMLRYDLDVARKELALLHNRRENVGEGDVDEAIIADLQARIERYQVVQDSLVAEIALRDTIIRNYAVRIAGLEQAIRDANAGHQADMDLLLQAQGEVMQAVEAINQIRFFNKKKKSQEALRHLGNVKTLYEQIHQKYGGDFLVPQIEAVKDAQKFLGA